MKKILAICASVALMHSLNINSYTYKIWNYRATPIEVQIKTTLLGAPKPKAIIPAAKKETRTIYTRRGVKEEPVTPSFGKVKIGGIHAGACLKDVLVNGEKTHSGISTSPCGSKTIVIGTGSKRYEASSLRTMREIPDSVKFGDWQ